MSSIEAYVNRTNELRVKSNNIFVSFKSPFSSVTPSTIARWIKTVLALAGIDTRIYGAHSTRGASTSNAVAMGIPVDVILQAANWRSESTFTRFYRRFKD